MESKTFPTKKEQERFSFSWNTILVSLAILVAIVAVAAVITLLPSSPLHIEIKDDTLPAVSLDSLSWNTERPDSPDPYLSVGDLPPNVYNKEFERPPKDAFTFRINRTPYLSNGELHDLFAQNGSFNKYDMTVTILLQDGTILYQSGLVSPNQYIHTVPCDVKLEESPCSAAAIVQIYDEDSTEEPLETFTEQLTITQVK